MKLCKNCRHLSLIDECKAPKAPMWTEPVHGKKFYPDARNMRDNIGGRELCGSEALWFVEKRGLFRWLRGA